jgi:hypothetical protein
VSNGWGKAPEGGWYLFLPKDRYADATVGEGFNGCVAPNLSCNIPAETNTSKGNALDLSGYLSCGNGSKLNDVQFSTSPAINWGDPDEGVYTVSSVTAKCGTAQMPSATCSGIVNVVGKSTCDAVVKNDWDKICPGIDFTLVKYESINMGNSEAGCYYVNSIANNFNPNSGLFYRINGYPKKGGTFGTNGSGYLADGEVPEKVDNGYYVYLPQKFSGGSGNATFTGGKPFCVDKIHTLTCNVNTDVAEGEKINDSKIFTCRSGDAPVITSYPASTPVLNWNNPAAGAYTFASANAIGTCGDSGPLTASCSGTLNSGAAYTELFFTAEAAGQNCSDNPIQLTAGNYIIKAVPNGCNGNFRCAPYIGNNVSYNGTRYTIGELENGTKLTTGDYSLNGSTVPAKSSAVGVKFQIYDGAGGLFAAGKTLKCGFMY